MRTRGIITPLFCVSLAFVFFHLRLIGANPPKLSATVDQAPYIITHPKNVTNVVEGDSATFSVVAGGAEPLSYQWLKDSQPIADATSPNLTLSDLASGSARYQAIVRNNFGSITSNPALLLVWRKAPPVITGGPGSQEVLQGQPFALRVFVVSPPPVTYQWIKDGAPIPNANQPELIIGSANLTDAGAYTVSVTNPYGSVVSSAVIITVTAVQQLLPVITSQPPASITVPKGYNFRLSVEATSNTLLTYQWYKDGAPLPFANSPQFYVDSARFEDAGEYYVILSNSTGTVTSRVSTVTVPKGFTIVEQPPPQLDLQPSMLVHFLKLTVSGAPPIARWYRNGEVISEGSVYATDQPGIYETVVTITDQRDSGDYFVVFSNEFLSLTSAVTHIEVILPTPKRPPSTTAPDLRQGLVAYWPFDELVDGQAKDAVGHYHLQVTPPYAEPYLTLGRLGNGFPNWETATYRSKGPEDELPINQHAAFTFSLWASYFQRSGSAMNLYLYYEGNSEDTNTFFGLSAPYRQYYNYSGRFQFKREPIENVDVKSKSIAISNRVWHHLTFVQDLDGNRWFYVDGHEDDVSLPAKPPSPWNLNFTRLGGEVPFVPGTLSAMFGPVANEYVIDDVAVWKRALSAAEIQLLVANGIPGYELEKLAISSVSIDQSDNTLSVQWKSIGNGTYSLLQSTNVAGPWSTVTSAYLVNVTNSFIQPVTTNQQRFLRIRRNSE